MISAGGVEYYRLIDREKGIKKVLYKDPKKKRWLVFDERFKRFNPEKLGGRK